MKFVSWKDLKKACADLKAIYTAATEEASHDALEEFGKAWNAKYPYLAIRNASEKWAMPIRDWGAALNQSSIEFENERVPFK
jgi:transposase-like protein